MFLPSFLEINNSNLSHHSFSLSSSSSSSSSLPSSSSSVFLLLFTYSSSFSSYSPSFRSASFLIKSDENSFDKWRALSRKYPLLTCLPFSLLPGHTTDASSASSSFPLPLSPASHVAVMLRLGAWHVKRERRDADNPALDRDVTLRPTTGSLISTPEGRPSRENRRTRASLGSASSWPNFRANAKGQLRASFQTHCSSTRVKWKISNCAKAWCCPYKEKSSRMYSYTISKVAH